MAGNDYWGRVALSELETSAVQVTLLLDVSSRASRTLKLLRKRRISFLDVFRLALCEMRRSSRTSNRSGGWIDVHSNRELESIIEQMQAHTLILFRAGVIIDAQILKLPIDVLNIHAATIPEFAGLMAIPRAIRSGSLKQQVTLHHVTSQVDQGRIEEVREYEIPAGASVCAAEDVAYATAVELLLDRVISAKK